MGDIVVKDNVRYRPKDAERADIVGAVQSKVPVEDTDAWRIEQEKQARTELEADLQAERARAELALTAELDQRRADFERELEGRRAALADAANSDGPADPGETPEAVIDGDADVSTKAVDPAVTKVREPETVKNGRGRKAPAGE